MERRITSNKMATWRKNLVCCLFLEVKTSWSWTKNWSGWNWGENWGWGRQMSTFSTESVFIGNVGNGVNNAIGASVSKL